MFDTDWYQSAWILIGHQRAYDVTSKIQVGPVQHESLLFSDSLPPCFTPLQGYD